MKEFESYWHDICNIHMITKHYLLLAEEIDGKTIIQPIKEHRDAYDHIIRVYLAKYSVDSGFDDSYLSKNMSKALGHEFRAFYDTADWFSIVIREKINEMLMGKEKDRIEKCYPGYPILKEQLLLLPDRIAYLREHKDVGKKGNNLYGVVNEYSELLDSLYSSYKQLSLALENYC